LGEDAVLMGTNATVPVYGLQNDIIGFASPRNARRMREEGVCSVFTRDPFTVMLKDKAFLSHPLTKEAIMAKKRTEAAAAEQAAQTPATGEAATMEKLGAATPENPDPQQHDPITDSGVVPSKPVEKHPKPAPKAKAEVKQPAAGETYEGVDLLAEAKKMTATGADSDFDPKGFYISNRYIDFTVIVSDIIMEPGKPNSALTWMPGEIKRMDTLGVSAKRLLESKQFVMLLKQSVLVQGRLDPHHTVRHGYWDGKPNPKEIVDGMASKTGSFTLEPNANNNWYIQKMLEQAKKEEEINNLAAGEDELAALQGRVDADKGIGGGK